MKLFTITENDAHQRLDKFLKKLFPHATRSLIYKLNRKGKIKVEQTVTEQGFKKRDNEYKLQPGDTVKIFVSDADFQTLSQKQESKTPVLGAQKFDTSQIVYQDGDIFVVNKDPGINVHPGDHKTKESNLIAQVQDYLGEKLQSLTFKPSLVHRLDRDTSGILIIAKKKQALTKLVSDFKYHKNIKKTYYALVLGKVSRSSGTITKKLKRIENPKKENKVQVSDSGQEAITHYTVLEQYELQLPKSSEIITALEVTIETGRMHQIRVHLAALGNPILLDKTYGNRQINGAIAAHTCLKRQALHSWKMQLEQPTKKKQLKLQARLKKDMQDFIASLKKI